MGLGVRVGMGMLEVGVVWCCRGRLDHFCLKMTQQAGCGWEVGVGPGGKGYSVGWKVE